MMDENKVEEDNIILSQDFFCTPDYITPDDKYLPVNLSPNREESVPCPKAPEKPKAPINKRPRQSFDELEENECLSLDDIEPEISLGRTTSTNKQAHRSSSAPRYGLSRYTYDFLEIKQIGYGNFSRVFKVVNRIDGCRYAVKKCTTSIIEETTREEALIEVKTMAELGFFKHLVGYFTSWIENDQLYIQMELCEQDLSTISSSKLFTEEELRHILVQIAKALQFMHERGKAHLDVKPDNIYVKKGVYKLGDFGCATDLDKRDVIKEGDARYLAHEILNENYDHLDKADIFSLGVTMYELVKEASILPLSSSLSLNLREGKFPVISGYSEYFQDLLKAMVDQDPVRRPSAKELVDMLEPSEDVVPQ